VAFQCFRCDTVTCVAPYKGGVMYIVLLQCHLKKKSFHKACATTDMEAASLLPLDSTYL
jgi:hypothetical protein